MKKPKFINAPIFLFMLFSLIILIGTIRILFFTTNSSYQDFGQPFFGAMTCAVMFFILGYLLYSQKMKRYNQFIELEENKKLTYENNQLAKEKEILEIVEKNKQLLSSFNGTLKITQTTEFGSLLISNQSKIDKEYILNLVKLNDYLNTKRKSIELQKQSINSLMSNEKNEIQSYYLINSDDEDGDISIENQINSIYKQNQYLLSLNNLSLKMINYLLEGNLFLFFSIFNQFDKLGIFNSEWENQLLTLMGDLNQNIMNVIDEIGFLESSISVSISDLQTSLR